MNHPNSSLLLAAGLFAIAAACSSSTPGPKAEVETQTQPAIADEDDEIRPLHDHMQEHFVRTDLMQKALIAGDLDRVRREARWLLDQPEPAGMPAAWTPFILELMKAAADVNTATEPRGLAHGVARMGAACGNCHREMGLELNLTWDEPPQESTDPRIHMLRHQWAAERFWDGLVATDDRGWLAGANVFDEDPLHSDELTPEGKIDPHIGQLANQLHEFGKRAQGTEDVTDRIQLYAKFVSTCATCHHDAGKGPASPPEIE